MPRKEIYKDGLKTQFSSTKQPANPGRRPSVFAKYIRENRVSLDDIRAFIASVLAYDADEIQKILKNEKDKPPVALILMLKAIMADMNKGELENFVKLLDRAYGKPTQTIIEAVAPVETQDVLKRLSDSELLDVMETQKNEKSKQRRKR